MTPDGTAKFDRMGHLKTRLFTLLCDENYKIEYTDFLLLFSSDPEPGNGKPRFYLDVSMEFKRPAKAGVTHQLIAQ